MKTKTKKLFLITMLTITFNISYAQEQWKLPPQRTEKVIDKIVLEVEAGALAYTTNGAFMYDDRRNYSDKQLYEELLKVANNRYSKSNPDFILREFASSKKVKTFTGPGEKWTYNVSATVVIIDRQKVTNEKLSQAINKALQNIREGSRLALDQIRITNGDEEDFKDKIIEILLDEGYKVVAKEYLEKLYEEQQAQHSGIYNDKTTVQDNNFSAVGYFFNVKQTEIAIKVQVINVSTGEYEANITVNL